MSDCDLVEKSFYDKFKVNALITFESVEGYGDNFLIWKTPTMSAGQVLYYKIGKKVETALWFVELWSHVPSALITFGNEQDRIVYQSAVDVPLPPPTEIGYGWTDYNGEQV